MTIKLHNWIQYAISPSTHLRQSEQQPLHQGDFRARATVPPLGNSLFQQHNAKPRDGYHYIFDLHFHRHVIYGTCLGCGAPATSFDALWTRIETAGREIPQEHIRALFDSMP